VKEEEDSATRGGEGSFLERDTGHTIAITTTITTLNKMVGIEI
jgi:hypothetical protein